MSMRQPYIRYIKKLHTNNASTGHVMAFNNGLRPYQKVSGKRPQKTLWDYSIDTNSTHLTDKNI